MPTADEIRKLYLDYFQSKGHMLVPSSSLIPATDPTLLLTTAGMVQMAPYFLGRAAPPARRMTSSQKCFRTTDLDSVGDYKHLTFFEMLGNFSVGDYFKRDAIAFAWELITERLGLARDRLYVTVYLEDDEAYKFWHEERGVSAERIYRYGNKDNWWGPPGAQGPCGPCSEMHYDFGAQYGCGPMASPAAIAAWEREVALRQAQGERGGQAQGDPSTGSEPAPSPARGRAAAEQPGCHPNCDRCERFMEIWNLVFMQFFQDLDKQRTPLPAPNIDTGMGLERIVTVLQGKRTVYDTDIFQPLLHRVAELCGRTYPSRQVSPSPSPSPIKGEGNLPHPHPGGEGTSPEDADHAIRVVAEHARGATFLIADGVVPSNEGRGYVLRRLIRRAVRYGRKLGLSEPFIGKVAELVVERMGAAYPELRQTKDFVLRVLQIEEVRFGETLQDGLMIDRGFRNEIAAIEQEAHVRLGDLLEYQTSPLVIENALGFLSPVINVAGRVFLQRAVVVREMDGANLARELLVDRFSKEDYQRVESLGREEQVKEIQHRLEMTSRLVKEAREKIPGQVVFRLWDTYGFPPEVTEEIAKEHGLSVDRAGFEKEMEAQRERARASTRMGGGVKREAFDYAGLGVGGTTFVGYERLEQQSVVLALVVDGQAAQSATEGQEVEAVLRETPFYAEKGGQLGDAGQITGPFGRVEVADTQSPVSEVIVHRGRVAQGSIAVGETARAAVDVARRMDTARNHTATHMLHAALRQVLGTHVRQAGSLVQAERLRFDFSHVQAVTRDELRRVEALVNEKIRQNLPVGFHETTYTKAVQEGALAFFGETYGASVRVVEVGECGAGLTPNPSPLNVERGTVEHKHPDGEACFSKEVCGGTHLTRTGQIGLCLVLGEQSVGAGMRRIEAVTGRHAEALVRERMDALESLAQSLAVTPAEVASKVVALQREIDTQKEALEQLEISSLRHEVNQAIDKQEKRIVDDWFKHFAQLSGCENVAGVKRLIPYRLRHDLHKLLIDSHLRLESQGKTGFVDDLGEYELLTSQFVQAFDRIPHNLWPVSDKNLQQVIIESWQTLLEQRPPYVSLRLRHANTQSLRTAADWIKNRLGVVIVALGTIINERPTIFISVSPSLVKLGVNAGQLARQMGSAMGGSGGGRPESAQAGGKDAAKLDEALRMLAKLVG